MLLLPTVFAAGWRYPPSLAQTRSTTIRVASNWHCVTTNSRSCSPSGPNCSDFNVSHCIHDVICTLLLAEQRRYQPTNMVA